MGLDESDKPHSTEAYTWDHRVADVLAVLDALSVDRTHFWGYSMGGRIGFDFAVRNPNRLLSLILGGARASQSHPMLLGQIFQAAGLQAFHESVMRPFPPSGWRAISRDCRRGSFSRGSSDGATELGSPPGRH